MIEAATATHTIIAYATMMIDRFLACDLERRAIEIVCTAVPEYDFPVLVGWNNIPMGFIEHF